MARRQSLCQRWRARSKPVWGGGERLPITGWMAGNVPGPIACFVFFSVNTAGWFSGYGLSDDFIANPQGLDLPRRASVGKRNHRGGLGWGARILLRQDAPRSVVGIRVTVNGKPRFRVTFGEARDT